MRIMCAVFVVGLVGCTVPQHRLVPAKVVTLAEGRVPPKNIPLFSDCLMDGFGDAQILFAKVGLRQQRRANGWRVETMHNALPMLTADLLDSGEVTLYEAKTAALVGSSGELKVFFDCLSKLGQP